MPWRRRRQSGGGRPAEALGAGRWARDAIMGLGSLVLTVALILVIIAGTMLAVFGPAAPLVTVPDVVGMKQEDAQARLDAARLTMKVVNSEFDKSQKEGAVVSASPYAGKFVRAGREVRVTISLGSRMAKVPKLKGLTVAEATQKLNDVDLQVGEEERKSSDEPADIVLSQTPPPATLLKRKEKVNLVVSGGKGFDVYDLGDHKFIFRRLKIIVPQGKVLQLVSVDVRGGDMEKSFLEQLSRPGEVLQVDLYGPPGARVRVRIEDETAFSESL